MKGNPNDESMKNHFIAKIWDAVDNEYKPIYVLADATIDIKGGVYLTDEIIDSDIIVITPQGVHITSQELIEVEDNQPVVHRCKLWIQPSTLSYSMLNDSFYLDIRAVYKHKKQ